MAGTVCVWMQPPPPYFQGMGQSSWDVGQGGDEDVQGPEGSESGQGPPAATGCCGLPARSAGAFHRNFPKIFWGKRYLAGPRCAWVGVQPSTHHRVGAAAPGGSQGVAEPAITAVSPSMDVQCRIS